MAGPSFTRFPGGVFARCRPLGRSFRIKLKILARRCPRRIKVLAGPLLGGVIGLIGGIPGVLIGLLLGYLLRELFSRTILNSEIAEYLENPGAQRFYEGEPGLAAWCALGVLVAARDFAEMGADSAADAAPPPGERIVKKVILKASGVFDSSLAEPYLMNRFSRLAWSRRDRLNPDLLAESLAARRLGPGAGLRQDAETLARGLSGLAEGEKSRRLAREITLILDPAPEHEKKPEHSAPASPQILPADPWKILGLPPGTDQKEVKAHYRRLAKQFHPDELQILEEKQREAAARAFMAIKEAYRQISGRR